MKTGFKRCVLFALFFLVLPFKVNAKIRPISYFIPKEGIWIDSSYFGKKDSYLQATVIIRDPNVDPAYDTIYNEVTDKIFPDELDSFCLQVQVYNYDGKLLKTKCFDDSHREDRWEKNKNYSYNHFKIMKTSQKKLSVYYYRMRMVFRSEKGKIYPISTWTKPVYTWTGSLFSNNNFLKRKFVITAKGITKKRIKKITINTPKVKGIKRYIVTVDASMHEGKPGYTHIRKVDGGNKIILNSIKYDPWTINNTWSAFCVSIKPVFRRKSDELKSSGTAENIYLNLYISKK